MARELYEDGASFVYVPRLMSAKELVEIVEDALEGDIDEHRRIASEMISSRREVLP